MHLKRVPLRRGEEGERERTGEKAKERMGASRDRKGDLHRRIIHLLVVTSNVRIGRGWAKPAFRGCTSTWVPHLGGRSSKGSILILCYLPVRISRKLHQKLSSQHLNWYSRGVTETTVSQHLPLVLGLFNHNISTLFCSMPFLICHHISDINHSILSLFRHDSPGYLNLACRQI